MTPILSILEIIRLSLAIAHEALQSMPPEAKAAFFERHEKRMAYFEGLLTRWSSSDGPN